MEDRLLRQLTICLNEYLITVDPGGASLPATDAFQMLKKALADRIAWYIEHNAALLKALLYRIDVAEKELVKMFETKTPAEIPGHLAELIIDRELEKIKTREMYRQNRHDDEMDWCDME